MTPSLQPRVQVRDTVCSTLCFGLSSIERVSEAAYFRIQPLSTSHPVHTHFLSTFATAQHAQAFRLYLGAAC